MKTSFISLAIVLTILSGSVTATAQVKTKPTAPVRAKAAAANPPIVLPVDSSTTRVKMPLKATAATLMKNYQLRGKGEFESQDQYMMRLAAHVDGRTFLVLATCVDGFSYDPDNEKVLVKLRGAKSGSSDDYDAIVASCDRAKSGTYVGTNAFGVKKVITKYIGVDYAFITKGTDGHFFPEATLAMPRDSARLYKPNVIAAFAVRPAIPEEGSLVLTTAETLEATIDDPVEVEVARRSLVVEFIEVWLIDRRTGRVVAKMPVS